MAEQDRTIRNKLKQLRLMVSGGSVLPNFLLKRWKEISGHTLLERYGMTETGLVLTNPYEPAEARVPGYVGKPFPGVEVALLDENDKMHNNSDQDGELAVKSSTMFKEYLNDPEATEAAFLNGEKGGWFKTGDIAVFHSDVDSYKILGREESDIVKNGGKKFSLFEVEEVVMQHEAV